MEKYFFSPSSFSGLENKLLLSKRHSDYHHVDVVTSTYAEGGEKWTNVKKRRIWVIYMIKVNEYRLITLAMKQLVSLYAQYENGSLENGAHNETHKETAVWFGIPTVLSCMFVTNKNEPCIHAIQIHISIDQTPAAYHYFFAAQFCRQNISTWSKWTIWNAI